MAELSAWEIALARASSREPPPLIVEPGARKRRRAPDAAPLQTKSAVVVVVEPKLCCPSTSLQDADFIVSHIVDGKSVPCTDENCQALASEHVVVDKRLNGSTLDAKLRAAFVVAYKLRALGFARCGTTRQSCCDAPSGVAMAYADARQVVSKLLDDFSSSKPVTVDYKHITGARSALSALCQYVDAACRTDGIRETVAVQLTCATPEMPPAHVCANTKADAACLALLSALESLYCELLATAAITGRNGAIPDPATFLRSLVAHRGGGGVDPNPLHSYLHLRDVEAELLDLASLVAAALAVEGAVVGPRSGTMKGRCPVTSPSVRGWWSATRLRVAAWASFACPTNEAISALGRFAAAPAFDGVLEVGAGTGYWAKQLRAAGVDVIATDVSPTDALASARGRDGSSGKLNEYHGRFASWTHVERMDASAAIERYSRSGRRVLFLCYPPPEGNMAAEALSRFTGDRLAVVGEVRGDTGTRAFEEALMLGWALVTPPVALAQWGDTAASMTLWRRRQRLRDTSVSADASCGFDVGAPLVRCVACFTPIALPKVSKSDNPQFPLRDRFVRSIWVCSSACAATGDAHEALRRELAARHLGLPRDPWLTQLPQTLMWKEVR